MEMNELLQFCVHQSASDLHLSTGLPPIIRIDGDLKRLDLPVVTQESLQRFFSSIMNDQQYIEYTENLEIDFSFTIPDVARFRVNAFHQQRGPSAVFRIIANKIPALEELGIQSILQKICRLSHGLVLITGPTGSGKSTTLAAIIHYINQHYFSHVITIEDPVEYLHESNKALIQQREIRRDTHSFNIALRSALREDPNIILIGELRDLETIRLALTAAETGHLVFATLHTSSASRSINRIIDVFASEEKNIIRSQFSESLQAVISQTLLKKKNGGRIAAFEIMFTTPAIRNLIREDKIAQLYSMIQTGAQMGMRTMEQDIKILIEAQIIACEERQGNRKK